MMDQVHMTAAGYARLPASIKEQAYAWLLVKKRKGTGTDRPDAKRIRLDSGSSLGKGGGGKSGGNSSRKGEGRVPVAGARRGIGGK